MEGTVNIQSLHVTSKEFQSDRDDAISLQQVVGENGMKTLATTDFVCLI